MIRRIRREVLLELRAEKKDEQRNHQSPRQHAARKLKCCQSQPDDVSHTQICRAHAGSREHAGSSRSHQVGASRRAQANLAVAESANQRVKILIRGKQTKSPEHVHQTPNSDIPEKIFGCLGTPLARLVNLGRCHGFREG